MKWNTRTIGRLRTLYMRRGLRVQHIAGALKLSPSAVKNEVRKLGLQRNFFRRPWLPPEVCRLRILYPHISTSRIAEILGRTIPSVNRQAAKMGLRKTAKYLASPSACRLRRGDNVGSAFRFPPGHVPANKGMRRPGYAPGRMAETQFKKGQRPHTWLPIGTVKPNGDGYLRRKIADAPERPGARGANSANWEFVHRRVWEDAHGPIPKWHRIWWNDGNHQNCALENLELLTDKEHMARTTIHRLPPELKSAIIAAGKLKRKIREKERVQEQHHGVAQASV